MSELLAKDGVAEEAVTLERSALMRYIGQSYDVATPVPSGTLTADSVTETKAEFNKAHEREYGVYSEAFGVAFVTLRVTGVGATTKPTPQAFQRAMHTTANGNGGAGAVASMKGRRQAYFGGRNHEVEVHDAAKLVAEQVLRGPALIEQQDGVIVLPPGSVGRADSYENVLITTEGAPA
jgi:N-methylhydantoinase A